MVISLFQLSNKKHNMLYAIYVEWQLKLNLILEKVLFRTLVQNPQKEVFLINCVGYLNFRVIWIPIPATGWSTLLRWSVCIVFCCECVCLCLVSTTRAHPNPKQLAPSSVCPYFRPKVNSGFPSRLRVHMRNITFILFSGATKNVYEISWLTLGWLLIVLIINQQQTCCCVCVSELRSAQIARIEASTHSLRQPASSQQDGFVVLKILNYLCTRPPFHIISISRVRCLTCV